MAKNGFKIFDTDTHVGPMMEVLDAYLTDAERSKLPAWKEFADVRKKEDFHKNSTNYIKGMRTYKRILGQATRQEEKFVGYAAAYDGPAKSRTTSPRIDYEPAVRIEEMDFEGVDVNLLLPSGWFGTWTSSDDVALEAGMYRAYNRWMNDYCAAYPERLGGVILLCARDIEGSLEELKRWGQSRWAWGIYPYAPYGMPLDHPDLEPFWAAAQDLDLVLTLHTFTSMPPYAPGGQDTWDNYFIQRSAAHPWCGMRNMAAIIGSGIMERYPKLRVGTLEAGHSWLPFWLARIDEHAETTKKAIPKLKLKPSEYAMSGRYFQSIEMHEGAKLTNSVFDFVGDDVLMYASDYPHSESRFPESVNTVMAWDMSDARKRKLFWENPVRFYTRSGHK